jgi:hypothetical protein
MRPGQDIERVFDERGQWDDTARERFQTHYTRTGKAQGRRRRPVIPAYSSDGD